MLVSLLACTLSALHWAAKSDASSAEKEGELRGICEMILLADSGHRFQGMRTIQGALAADLMTAHKSVLELLVSNGHSSTAYSFWTPQVHARSFNFKN